MFVLDLIFAYIYIIIGAVDIYLAIHRFKEERYFWCGLWSMSTIYVISLLFKMVMSS